MSSIARTAATGQAGLLPPLLQWSSSLADDLHFAADDLLGSAAHVTMLGRTGLIPVEDARILRSALLELYAEEAAGTSRLAGSTEEDVHMAVEAELGRRVGPVANRLHTARSRNDQVALDLRMFVRRQGRDALEAAVGLCQLLLERAPREFDTLMPAYTHRQRAQPISVAFLLCAWVAQMIRAAETIEFAVRGADRMPLGSGACSGTSLPIDRTLVARLLGFSQTTENALDTVGDRDFILDWVWGAGRVVLALGKVATDLVDFSTSEFGLVRLDSRIATGSSMMPQKKNPDIFELVRGKAAGSIGDIVSMLTLVKGLASGYNRDQQEDRAPLLSSTGAVRGAMQAMSLSLPHVEFDGRAGLAALTPGFTQATDLAERLVVLGVPFRDAYRAVGALVHEALARGIALTEVPEEARLAIHPQLDDSAILVLDPARAVEAKASQGGTSRRSVVVQTRELAIRLERLSHSAARITPLTKIRDNIQNEPLENSP